MAASVRGESGGQGGGEAREPFPPPCFTPKIIPVLGAWSAHCGLPHMVVGGRGRPKCEAHATRDPGGKKGGEGSKYATRGLSLSPIWPRSMYTYFFLYHRLPMRRALCLQAYCLLTTNPLSRNIHHHMFFTRSAQCPTHGAGPRTGQFCVSPHPPPCGAMEVACIVVAAFRRGREARRAARPEHPPPLPTNDLGACSAHSGLPHGVGGRGRPQCEAHTTRKTWR